MFDYILLSQTATTILTRSKREFFESGDVPTITPDPGICNYEKFFCVPAGIQTQGLLIASQMLLPLSHWDSGIGVEHMWHIYQLIYRLGLINSV